MKKNEISIKIITKEVAILFTKKENQLKVVFPNHFLTDADCIWSKNRKKTSADGTPRYTVNPNAPGTTYCMKTCLEDGCKPIFKRLYKKQK
jgi:hypothetical protein